MDVNVSGRKIDVGEALRSHVQNAIDGLSDKYFSRAVDSSVTFSKTGHLYNADCQFHLPNNVNLQSHGEADDIYVAFDLGLDKLEKQLRRHKRRTKNHHNAAGKEFPDEDLD